MQPKLECLFTGHAPVHFACVRPLYDWLVNHPSVDMFVSGGLESERDGMTIYDEAAMYGPMGVPSEHVLPVEEIRERDFDIIFGANTTLLLPRSVKRRIQIFHGMSFRNRAVRDKNLGCDHYFLIGPYMRRQFESAGLFSEHDPRAVPIGFLKTDRLLNGTLDRSELLARQGFNGARPVVLYAPTGLKQNSLELMGEDVIERLKQTGQYDMLIKLHDHPKRKDIDWHERLGRLEDDHCRVARDLDVIPLLFLADLLISDASSVSNEFALLDRPMIFLDVPYLIEKARLKEGSRLDLETWGRSCGLVVEKAEDVVAAVEKSLADPTAGSDVRQAMVKDLFYNPGKATDAATTWLEAHCLNGSVPA